MQRVVEPPDPNDHLLEQILSRENMQKAWKRVKANKGKPGIDHMSVDDFPEFARSHWEGIRDSLFSGTYQPLPVKRVEIPKATGEAQQVIQASEGYATERVNNALGDANRFKAIYREYARAPLVTRKRLYLEALNEILPKIKTKVVFDEKMQNVLPLLNLKEEVIK